MFCHLKEGEVRGQTTDKMFSAEEQSNRLLVRLSPHMLKLIPAVITSCREQLHLDVLKNVPQLDPVDHS